MIDLLLSGPSADRHTARTAHGASAGTNTPGRAGTAPFAEVLGRAGQALHGRPTAREATGPGAADAPADRRGAAREASGIGPGNGQADGAGSPSASAPAADEASLAGPGRAAAARPAAAAERASRRDRADAAPAAAEGAGPSPAHHQDSASGAPLHIGEVSGGRPHRAPAAAGAPNGASGPARATPAGRDGPAHRQAAAAAEATDPADRVRSRTARRAEGDTDAYATDALQRAPSPPMTAPANPVAPDGPTVVDPATLAADRSSGTRDPASPAAAVTTTPDAGASAARRTRSAGAAPDAGGPAAGDGAHAAEARRLATAAPPDPEAGAAARAMRAAPSADGLEDRDALAAQARVQGRRAPEDAAADADPLAGTRAVDLDDSAARGAAALQAPPQRALEARAGVRSTAEAVAARDGDSAPRQATAARAADARERRAAAADTAPGVAAVAAVAAGAASVAPIARPATAAAGSARGGSPPVSAAGSARGEGRREARTIDDSEAAPGNAPARRAAADAARADLPRAGGAAAHAPAELAAWLTGSPATSATGAGDGAAPAAPVHAGQISTPVTDPHFAPALGARLTMLVRDGVQQAQLSLNPQEMGPITVRIHVDGSSARIELVAENAQTRQVLEQSMPVLAGTLREQGLTLAGGGVFDQPRQPAPQDGAGGPGNGPSGGAGREAGNGSGRPGEGPGPRAGAEPAGDALRVLGTAAGRGSARGVVDVYA